MATRTKIDPAAQLTFSALTFKHSRALLTINETAEALGTSPNHIRELVDRTELGAAPINDASAERSHVRILRYTVEAWFLEQWFSRHGTEYPVANSEDVSFWRNHLRTRRAADLKLTEARNS